MPFLGEGILHDVIESYRALDLVQFGRIGVDEVSEAPAADEDQAERLDKRLVAVLDHVEDVNDNTFIFITILPPALVYYTCNE